MDIVEVSPPYDHAETTAMIANRAALEAISALALKRRDGATIRFAGAAARGMDAAPADVPRGRAARE
jgi:agmatinase